MKPTTGKASGKAAGPGSTASKRSKEDAPSIKRSVWGVQQVSNSQKSCLRQDSKCFKIKLGTTAPSGHVVSKPQRRRAEGSGTAAAPFEFISSLLNLYLIILDKNHI